MKHIIILSVILFSTPIFAQWSPVSTRPDQINRGVVNTESYLGYDSGLVVSDLAYIVNFDSLYSLFNALNNKSFATSANQTTIINHLSTIASWDTTTLSRRDVRILNFPESFEVSNFPSSYSVTTEDSLKIYNSYSSSILSRLINIDADLSGTLAVNSTIQNATLAATQSGIWNVNSTLINDSIKIFNSYNQSLLSRLASVDTKLSSALTVNSTIQNSSIDVTQSGSWTFDLSNDSLLIYDSFSPSILARLGSIDDALSGTWNIGSITTMPETEITLNGEEITINQSQNTTSLDTIITISATTATQLPAITGCKEITVTNLTTGATLRIGKDNSVATQGGIYWYGDSMYTDKEANVNRFYAYADIETSVRISWGY